LFGGTESNHYVANWEVDVSDTGDQRHYGDTGVFIGNPNLSFTYTFSIYLLAGAQPNVGATSEALFTHPLSVTGLLQEPPVRIYLPVIMKNAATSSTSPRQAGNPIPGQYVLLRKLM